MAKLGRLGRSRIGWDGTAHAVYVGLTASAMPTQNNGWAARFMAEDTRDIKSVTVHWSAVTTPGTVQLRIETIDATTGKPTGTLYDAVATKDFTPTVNTQTITFDVLPSTGLVAGTEYAVVLLTTVTGTAHTLRSHYVLNYPLSTCPAIVLTAADASTRSNFAEVAGAAPHLALTFDDDVVEGHQFVVTAAGNSTYDIYGTRAAGLKFASIAGMKVKGCSLEYGVRSGAYSNLRATLYDPSDNVLVQRTLDRDSLASLGRGIRFYWPVQTLGAGDHRIVFDQTDHATGATAYYRLIGGQLLHDDLRPSGVVRCETTNIEGVPITWSETTGIMLGCNLIPDDIVDVPDPNDVQDGVTVGNTTGDLVLPTEAQVENGVGFGADGTEFTGSLVAGGGGGQGAAFRGVFG